MEDSIEYEAFQDERQMPRIMSLIEKDLSEPYSIFTYRYFIHNWPDLCLLVSSTPNIFGGTFYRENSCRFHNQAKHQGEIIGVIVCKLERHKNSRMRGYIAMLAVEKSFRKQGIGSALVQRVGERMKFQSADEVLASILILLYYLPTT
jgi:peptide alpha-N-acetyltransferase